MQRIVGMLLLLQTLVITQASALEETGHGMVHTERKSPRGIYVHDVSELIIGSTPFEQESKWGSHHSISRTTVTIGESGRFSNWRISEVSGSIARDFWTLYAVASCPPTKPAAEIKTPFTIDICNARLGAIVSLKESEDWRIEQGWSISRNIDAKNIFFCLIPASFIRSFPNTVSIADVTARENLVGIPVNRLCSDGKTNWSEKSANDFLDNRNEVSKFLNEWSQFFQNNPKPSRADITQFASSLKTKYKALLVTEGEPEAPLP
jgi:hypothetical protein